MRIALFHNYYKMRGGEDEVFEFECRELKKAGHEVFPYDVRNEESFSKSSAFSSAQRALCAPNNRSSYRSILQFLEEHKPDIGHVHNWFPLISPAIYEAHRDFGIPVVQTLHNYRLGCANGTFRRDGTNCQKCISESNWNAVKYRCYRNSMLGGLVWKRIIDRGWRRGTFNSLVSHYISPSKEVLNKHCEIGIPESKISIIPNACSDPGHAKYEPSPNTTEVVFLGRLVSEKGADVLVEAWKRVVAKNSGDEAQSNLGNVSLKIIGDGAELENLRELSAGTDSIHIMGRMEHSEAMDHLRRASLLVFPSRWAEPFGLGVVEAFSMGKPVIASDCGAPKELVQDGVDGLIVPPNEPQALASALERLLRNSDTLSEMGLAARSTYEKRFTASVHIDDLVTLYNRLVKEMR